MENKDKKILIIDDSPSHRLLLKTYLKDFTILEAENGIEALKVLEDNKVDLIVCDFEMPEMNGPELVNEIEKVESYRKIPFIMCSANKIDSKYLKNFEENRVITEWIEKSIKSNELKRIVYNILDA